MLKRAARQYAAKLGRQLLQDYGSAQTYTARQIEASAARAKLPSKYIELGYAGFAGEKAFCAITVDIAGKDYAALRTILKKQTTRDVPAAGIALAPENRDALAGFPHMG